jgi:hypothetical protein
MPTSPPPLHTYETVAESHDGTVERLRAEGGWLYRTRTWDNRSNTFQTALAFAPDPPVSGPKIEATGTCFWFANLAGGELTADDTFHALPIGEGYPNGDAALVTNVEGGIQVNQLSVCLIDYWVEFAVPAQSNESKVGVELDKAGTLLTRGSVQMVPGQEMRHTGYHGLLQAGEIIRPAAMCWNGHALTVQPSSYITVHVIPLGG